jgi:hypothetical protein
MNSDLRSQVQRNCSFNTNQIKCYVITKVKAKIILKNGGYLRNLNVKLNN